MSEIIFNFGGIDNVIQCQKDEKFKDICTKFKSKINAEEKDLYFMYNGTTILNEELTFNEIANSEDKLRNKMNILVNEIESGNNNNQKINNQYFVKSKNIICPECKEDIKLSINGYNLSLIGCKNRHEIDNIYFDKFEQTQMINN